MKLREKPVQIHSKTTLWVVNPILWVFGYLGSTEINSRSTAFYVLSTEINSCSTVCLRFVYGLSTVFFLSTFNLQSPTKNQMGYESVLGGAPLHLQFGV